MGWLPPTHACAAPQDMRGNPKLQGKTCRQYPACALHHRELAAVISVIVSCIHTDLWSHAHLFVYTCAYCMCLWTVKPLNVSIYDYVYCYNLCGNTKQNIQVKHCIWLHSIVERKTKGRRWSCTWSDLVLSLNCFAVPVDIASSLTASHTVLLLLIKCYIASSLCG